MSSIQEQTPLSSVLDEAKPESASLRYAWYVVFVLMICLTLSFIDRQILSLLVGPMKRELALSDTQIGLLGGLAFSLFYTFLGLPIGRLVDRYSRRNIIAVGLILWSLMTALCAVARGFGGLFVARMGVGVGEATLSPAAMSLITDYFPKERLSTALSIYAMGVTIGSGLALIIGGIVVQAVSSTPTIDVLFLGPMSSWRVTFITVGLPGLLVALLLYTIIEPKRKGILATNTGAGARLNLSATWVELKKRWRVVSGLSVGMMFTCMYVYALFFWAPVVLQRVHGWSPRETGTVLGIIVLVGGSLGLYAGGWLSDRLLRKGILSSPAYVGVIGSLGSLVCLGAAFAIPNNPVLTAALCFPGMALAMSPTGSSYAGIQMVLPNQVRGQAGALLLFIMNLGGLTLGPLLPGVFTDHLFGNEALVSKSLALTVALAAACGSAVFAWSAPAFTRALEKDSES